MNDPPRRSIGSRHDFNDALRSAFALAADGGAREIWLCDATFADWPLSERAVIADLSRWARAPRRITLLAQTFDEVVRRHGRWTEWRRQWSHLVECRTNSELEATQIPTLCLVSGAISVRLFDPVHHRGMASREAADEAACREWIDAVLQRSTEAYPATTLGL